MSNSTRGYVGQFFPRGGHFFVEGDTPHLDGLLSAISEEFPDATVYLERILEEKDPRTCDVSRQEWFRLIGNVCQTDPRMQDLQTDRDTITANYGIDGGQSAAFFDRLGSLLGLELEVRTFSPATCVSPCTSMPSGPECRFLVLLIVRKDVPVLPATCVSPCDSPIEKQDYPPLSCVVEKVAHAHSEFLIVYEPEEHHAQN